MGQKPTVICLSAASAAVVSSAALSAGAVCAGVSVSCSVVVVLAAHAASPSTMRAARIRAITFFILVPPSVLLFVLRNLNFVFLALVR